MYAENVNPDITESGRRADASSASHRVESINEQSISEKESEESTKAMKELINKKQDINEVMANVPIEFEVDDKILQIHSKSANRMVIIDKFIGELQLLGEEEIEFPEFEEDLSEEKLRKQRNEFMIKVEEKNAKILEKTFKVIFNIVNPSLDEPDISIEWLMEHLDITESGTANQIMDAYNEKCNPGSLVKKILMSRKF